VTSRGTSSRAGWGPFWLTTVLGAKPPEAARQPASVLATASLGSTVGRRRWYWSKPNGQPEPVRQMPGLTARARSSGHAGLLASRPGADAVVWRCSDQASFVTGATLPVDGTQHDGTKPPQMYRYGQTMAAGKP
jgi:hypothetical protein